MDKDLLNKILNAGLLELDRERKMRLVDSLKNVVNECAEAKLSGKETCERLLKYLNDIMLQDSLRRY